MRGASVCVLGAGPAGAVAAYRLARLGHEVTLIARLSAGRRRLSETAPLSLAALLAGIGLGHAVEMAAHRIAAEGLMLWRSEAPETKPTPVIVLRRDRFDALLLHAAKAAGARVFDASACAPLRHGRGGWMAGRAFAADFLIDGRGRRGGRALGARTVALAARWRNSPPLPAATCLEALSDAWAWAGVAPDGGYEAALFLDPERLAGLDAAGRMGLYMDALAQTRLLKTLLEGRLSAPPAVMEATARLGQNLAEPDRVSVGDAAVAAEPLSSQGIKGAIVSALQGAAVVHTALTRPEDASLALAFHRRSRFAAARAAKRHAGSFHAEVLNRFETPFWRRRAAFDATPLASPEATRAIVAGALRLSPQARLEDGPVLDGVLIRRRRVIDHPDLEAPIAYLGPVELAPLLEAASFPAAPDRLVRVWSERLGPANANAVLTWLRARRLLVAA